MVICTTVSNRIEYGPHLKLICSYRSFSERAVLAHLVLG